MNKDRLLAYHLQEKPLSFEVAKNRARLEKQLRSGKPIYILQKNANGDDMINVWVHMQVLQRACREFGLPETQIDLHTRDTLEESDKSDFYISPLETSDRLISPDKHPFQQRLYLMAACAFGIRIDPHDLDYAPQPIQMELGAFKNYDKPQVIADGERIRRTMEMQGQRNIVITQFGGSMAKRFTDAQVEIIARFIRQHDATAHITVVTDKPFLTEEIERGWVTSRDFPVDHIEFLQQNRNQSPSAYGDSVDNVVTGDINKMSAHLYASDLTVSSDGFGAWLSAGNRVLRPDRNGILMPQDQVILYTLADPDIYKIPGATVVTSALLQQEKKPLSNNNVMYDFTYFRRRLAQEPILAGKYQQDSASIPMSMGDIQLLLAKTQELL